LLRFFDPNLPMAIVAAFARPWRCVWVRARGANGGGTPELPSESLDGEDYEASLKFALELCSNSAANDPALEAAV
jgi:hypothetical protein